MCVENSNQMRWAYRRLALLGVPVDFVYTGSISAPQKLLGAIPVKDQTLFDSGWGYLGSFFELKGQQGMWLIGTARLMPQDILGWLLSEAPNRFLTGDVFVAPAPLIGMSRPEKPVQLEAFADICEGTTVTAQRDQVAALFDLDLPFIDGLSSLDFNSFIADHGDDLNDFRNSFIGLVHGYYTSETAQQDAINGLRYEVSELTKSVRYQRLRALLSKCKGQIKTFEAGLGALAAMGAVYGGDPFAGTAVIAGAGKAVHDLWVQSKNIAPDLGGKRLRLLWDIGLTRIRKKQIVRKGKFVKTKSAQPEEIGPHHWLCPPTGGINFAFVKKD